MIQSTVGGHGGEVDAECSSMPERQDELRIVEPVDIQSQPYPIHHIFETPTHEYATIASWSGAD